MAEGNSWVKEVFPNKEEDLKYLKNPGLWPCWPIMPMKRRGKGLPEIASLVAIEGYATTLLLDKGTLLWEGEKYKGKSWKEILDMIPSKKAYESAEAILADGWECD